ncbi:MAG: DNA alkylation repair protein [Clostridia bacterium]|nr:DNA alkylation repair protein [Clostridia bacterium]
MSNLKRDLFALQDLPYREFHASLIPTVDPARIIGIRTPVLRRFAKSFRDAGFLESLPHYYYEENNLHVFLINQIKDFDQCLAAVQAFLPYVDNWATCDSLRPSVFAKNKEALLPAIQGWLQSEHPYTLRFGIEMLMCHYLDRDFEPCYLNWVAKIQTEEYYVQMMVAWYFATALAKQYDAAFPFIEGRRLDPWIHQKTIQKAVESLRVSPAHKEQLKKHRIS